MSSARPSLRSPDVVSSTKVTIPMLSTIEPAADTLCGVARPRSEVAPETGCRLCAGSCNRPDPEGYGQVAYEGRTQLVNRVVYRLLVGPIPDGFRVAQVEGAVCLYKRCCNPGHLEAVTKRH
jgi:hypothetical protein